MISLETLTPKELYKSIISKITDKPTSRATIEKITCTKNLNCNEIYLLIQTLSIDALTRIFQYKILNNILYLNNSLYKMGHTDSPLCSYCQKANETTKHLFFEYTLTQKVWKELQNYFKNYLTLPCLELRSAIVGLFFLNP